MNTNQQKKLSAFIEVILSSTQRNDSLLRKLMESLNYITDFHKDFLNMLERI